MYDKGVTKLFLFYISNGQYGGGTPPHLTLVPQWRPVPPHQENPEPPPIKLLVPPPNKEIFQRASRAFP